MSRDYLSQEAASDYLLLCCVSHKMKIIDDATCNQRLVTLSQLTEPKGRTNRLVRLILKNLDLNAEADHWDEASDSAPPSDTSEIDVENQGGLSHPNPTNLAHFRITFNHTNWHFRPGDPDFFPSVPHAHNDIGRKKKLDAYQGYIYEKKGKSHNRIGRLPRRDIVTLWNDDDFREEAKGAISFFMGLNPNFNWGGRKPGHLKNGRKVTDLPNKQNR